MSGQLVQATFYGGSFGNNNDDLGFTYNYAYQPSGAVASKTLVVESTNHYCCSPPGDKPLTASVAVNYTYDNQGALQTVQYPAMALGWNPLFTYTLDELERPTGLSYNVSNNNYTLVPNVTYNAANLIIGGSGVPSHTYNNMWQMLTAVSGLGDEHDVQLLAEPKQRADHVEHGWRHRRDDQLSI